MVGARAPPRGPLLFRGLIRLERAENIWLTSRRWGGTGKATLNNAGRRIKGHGRRMQGNETRDQILLFLNNLVTTRVVDI